MIIHDPFRYIIFDIKARFTEDIRSVPMEGGELLSSMEPGVRIQIAKRSFDEPAKVKLRVSVDPTFHFYLAAFILIQKAMFAEISKSHS